MKPKILPLLKLIVILNFVSMEAYSQSQGEEDAFEALYALDFVDSNRGWAVGRNSVILHTEDGGKSWVVQHRDISSEERVLFSVSFADEKRGLACGQGGQVLRTENGGRSWAPSLKVRSPDWEDLQEDILEIEDEIELLTKKHGDICSDVDRDDEDDLCVEGALEERVSELARAKEYLSNRPAFVGAGHFAQGLYWRVRFVEKSTAYIISSNGLLRSDDFGKTWVVVGLPHGRAIRNFSFLDRNRGWIVGDGGFVATTNNGGQNWDEISLDTPWKLTAVFFEDELTGSVAGEAGVVLRTSDGGQTWDKIVEQSGDEIREIVWIDDKHAHKSTMEKVFITDDGFRSWQSVEMPFDSPDFEVISEAEAPTSLAIQFLDSQNAFAVGTHGLVLRSSDGGKTWMQLRSRMMVLQKRIEEVRSIDHARMGYNVAIGYVHPAGDISSRFGPGMFMDFEFLAGRGRFKFGGGFKMFMMSDRETIVTPAGEIDDDPTKLEYSGILFNVPFLTQFSIFERGSWLLRGLVGVGFVYHGTMIEDSQAQEIPDSSDYGRSRIGICTTQSLVFGWMYGKSRTLDPNRMSRGGFYLKAGVQESWTWNVDGTQTDLGTEDTSKFGTEFYPFVALGVSLYN